MILSGSVLQEYQFKFKTKNPLPLSRPHSTQTSYFQLLKEHHIKKIQYVVSLKHSVSNLKSWSRCLRWPISSRLLATSIQSRLTVDGSSFLKKYWVIFWQLTSKFFTRSLTNDKDFTKIISLSTSSWKNSSSEGFFSLECTRGYDFVFDLSLRRDTHTDISDDDLSKATGVR